MFLPGGSYNLFPSPVFPLCVYKVRLHNVENRKHAMAYSTFATFPDGDAELPDIASQLTALAKMSM